MTQNELKALREGDIVRSKASGQAYVVTGNHGTHVTAVRTADVTNPEEWDIVQSAAKEKANRQFLGIAISAPRCRYCDASGMAPHSLNCPMNPW